MHASKLVLAMMLSLGVVVVMGNLGGCPFSPFPPVDNTNDNGNVNDNGDDNANDNGDDNANDNGDDNANDNDNGDDNANDNGDDNGNDNGDTQKSTHELIFTEIIPSGYQGPESCMVCHSDVARDLITTGHWNWSGTVANIEGLEGTTHGKIDLINNFCIAVPSNEGRCAACHPSYGWKDNTFDFTSTENVDCLICHDTTGTYRKHPSANGGGGPAALVIDGEVTPVDAEDLQEVAYNVGTPSRQNCGLCHFYAGGGDNVKHGDLSSALVSPTSDLDVHMGGLNFSCQSCHTEEDHGIAGMALHSVNEGGGPIDCLDCHDEEPHEAGGLAFALNLHTDRVHCTTCHIPTFARSVPTKVEWYWEDAGQDVDPIPTDEFGKPTYDKKKGTFVWDKNVQPEYMWFDGEWQRMVIGVSDTFANAGTVADPVVIAAPTATIDDADAMIYPFKKMVGNQPADANADGEGKRTLLVPHLFGTATGDNPYWGNYEWGPALEDGTTYAGQDYSGEYEFVNTVMYLRVSHQIAPASEALGCNDCHGVAEFWDSLGYDSDPLGG